MSKAVRWQVPFAAQDGTKYRVDIYDEGYTGSPVELTAGETPFTTDEDDSDDFFAPVRTQSGTLQICTETPSGSTIKLEDILPASNIDRPVRLVNLSNSNAVEWQGFLSCEAYSQDYIGIPQNLDLPLIGVLEAMDSVEADPAKLSGLNTVGTTIEKLLDIFIDKAGVSYFSEYYLPTISRGSNIVSKYIDASVLFEQKEYNNENSTTYIVSGLSLQDCLSRIATYMGWCLREKSGTLYFMAANETVGYNRVYRTGVVNSQGNIIIKWQGDLSVKSVSTKDIDDLDWMGNGHQRSVAQGAKSVEVVASLKKYKLNIVLPDCPLGNIQQYTGTSFSTATGNPGTWGPDTSISAICNKDGSFSNICDFYCYEMTSEARIGSKTTIGNVLTCALVNPSASIFGQSYYGDGNFAYFYNKYIGSFLAKIKRDDEEYIDGLYIVGLRDVYRFNPISSTNHLFSIKSIAPVYFVDGSLKLRCDAITIYSGDTGRLWGDYDGRKSRIRICIKIGDKYWNGTSWVGSFATFLCKENELSIPINTRLQGEVSIRLYGYMDDVIIPADQTQGFASDMFIKGLSLDYEITESDLLSDRSENKYFRLLGTNFRDEISISIEIASSLNNKPSPSLIMNSTTEAMTELNYGSTQSPDMRRPEVDLLNRLAAYYGAARQRLELEVAHITTPLPQLRLNGINDGKVYLPMAESRDWRTGVCKLTCIECPQ